MCGVEYKVYPYRTVASKYCSYNCFYKRQKTGKQRVCKNCGKEFVTPLSQFSYYKGAGKYCSRQCSYRGIVKETKVKPVKDKYGRSRRYDDLVWQKAVRDRDSSTCKRCGVYDKAIHTHHIVLRSQSKALKHVVSNGICLCGPCHSWVHNHPKEARDQGYIKSAPII